MQPFFHSLKAGRPNWLWAALALALPHQCLAANPPAARPATSWRSPAATINLTGYVFEDPNYGGGAGRALNSGASGISSLSGATVELYDAAGNFVATTPTGPTGQYRFSVNTSTTYQVRVVNATVMSSRSGYTSSLRPVQTYAGPSTDPNAGNRVGGAAPQLVDAGPNTAQGNLSTLTTPTTTAESLVSVTTGEATATGPDFGYSFDVVVNTNDSGQGSVRQFVLNANALGDESSLAQGGPASAPTGFTRSTTSTTNAALAAGRETSIFMIPDGMAHPGLLAATNGGPANALTMQNGQQVAVITLTVAGVSLAIVGPNAALTTLDGGTQTANIGNTNAAVLGLGGSVGTANSLSYTSFSGPEVELLGEYVATNPTTNRKPRNGINVLADDFTLRNVAMRNFGNPGGQGTVGFDVVPGRTGLLLGNNSTTPRGEGPVRATLENNVLGSDAALFAAPTTEPFMSNEGDNGRSNQHIQYDVSGTSVNVNTLTVRTNLIGFSERRALHVQGNSSRQSGYNINLSVYDNVFQDAGVAGNPFNSKSPYANSAAGAVELIMTTQPFIEVYNNRISGPGTISSFGGLGSDGIEINNAEVSGGVDSVQIANNRRRDAGAAQPGSRVEQNSITNQRLGILCQSNVAFASYALDNVSFAGNSITNNYIGGSNQGANQQFQNNVITGSVGLGFANIGPGVTFSGNTISNNGGTGLQVGDGNQDAPTTTRPATTGVVVGPGNVFANNSGTGLFVANPNTRATLSQNSYYANGGLGIDLTISFTTGPAGPAPVSDGVTPNNGTLNQNFANQELDYPILTTATLAGTQLTISGYVGSMAGQTTFAGARVEFFKADNNPANQNGPLVAGDGQSVAHGEGRTYLGFLTADANGNVSGTLTVNGGLASGDFVTATATLGTGAQASTSEFGNNVRVNEFALIGYVFEDVNYGGGSGRPITAAGTVPRPGATVELYDANGNFAGRAVTDANGRYLIMTLPGTVTVRVVNSTVTSSRTGAVASLLPVQTYNGTTTRVGGENPALVDAPANAAGANLSTLTTATATPESLGTATIVLSPTIGPDFGFNFDLIVNTNRAGQGSLAQFITNSNKLANTELDQVAASSGGPDPAAGRETSIFMIPDGQAHDGLLAANNGGPASQLTGGVAVISLTTAADALPAITDANTSLNGATQTQNIGNTNNAALGTGGTVGTTNTALAQVNGPEVQVQGTSAINVGIDAAGAGTRINSISVLGFGSMSGDNYGDVRIGANNVSLTQSVIGTSATSFTAPTIGAAGDGVRVYNGANSLTISGNLIGYNGGEGITTGANVTGVVITGNEVRGNGQANAALGGINNQSAGSSITNNLLANNAGQGFDSFQSGGGNFVSGNTVSGNGGGTTALAPVETAGLRVYGPGNNVSQNIISNNYGAGIQLTDATSPATTTFLSQNSIFGNGNATAANGTAPSGNIGIDLQKPTDSETAGTAPYVTLNNSNGTNGANGLVNYPILVSAVQTGNTLVLKGYAKPGAAIELFTAQANPATVNNVGTNFGQGRGFITTLTEGGSNDSDARTGLSYSGPINGFDQGSDTNANGFTFTITLSSPLPAGTLLTSTGTLGGTTGSTSEFSGNVAVTVTPLPVTLAAFTAQAVQNRDAQLNWLTASELNNAYFAVERSLDGNTFKTIGQVAGQGNKITATEYSYTDAGIGRQVSGVVYYRLRQVDRDGSTSYSPVRNVSFTADASAATISLYPNPATASTTLDLSALPASNTYQAQLLDLTGRLVRRAALPGGQTSVFDLSHVASGTYQVLLTGQRADGSALRQVLRLTRE